jgi:O-acetyl-ADP-ribose deacetylase (regulator of RNase III)
MAVLNALAMETFTIGTTGLVLTTGDITKAEVDAIVNAANSSLMGGGGVDGAIHRAGGPAILEECKRIVAAQGRLPPGRAVLTDGGRLPARHVIHTVGPIWRGGDDREDETLRSCYRESLALARRYGIARIAFPSISTGAFGYPVERAARVALEAVREAATSAPGLTEVRFVLFDERTYRAYGEAAKALGLGSAA